MLQPKGQAPPRPDYMPLAAQRMQQPLSPGLLGQGPPLAGPSFAPPHYGALPGHAPQPSPRPDSYPLYPNTSYGYPLQQSYDGYGQSLNPAYLGQPAGSPLANQHLPYALTTAALADMSAMTAMASSPQQQPQLFYGQQTDAAHVSQLHPNLPPNPPNAYQHKATSAQNFTVSGDANFPFSQPYASMPAGGNFYS